MKDVEAYTVTNVISKLSFNTVNTEVLNEHPCVVLPDVDSH